MKQDLGGFCGIIVSSFGGSEDGFGTYEVWKVAEFDRCGPCGYHGLVLVSPQFLMAAHQLELYSPVRREHLSPTMILVVILCGFCAFDSRRDLSIS